MVSILAGLAACNNFILPPTLPEPNIKPILTLGLPLGVYTVSTAASGYDVSLPIVMAGVILSVLPVFFLLIAMRRQYVKGIGGFALR